MNRIKSEWFLEVFNDGLSTNQEDFRISGNIDLTPINHVKYLKVQLRETRCLRFTTIALFLIKPTTIPLSQRLEARKAYQQKNVK